MNTANLQGAVCQSCSMPMNRKEDFGTNADGSPNKEYCQYCYENGHFTAPDATVDQMIRISTDAMRKMKMPENLIEQTKKAIPKLKRWISA